MSTPYIRLSFARYIPSIYVGSLYQFFYIRLSFAKCINIIEITPKPRHSNFFQLKRWLTGIINLITSKRHLHSKLKVKIKSLQTSLIFCIIFHSNIFITNITPCLNLKKIKNNHSFSAILTGNSSSKYCRAGFKLWHSWHNLEKPLGKSAN